LNPELDNLMQIVLRSYTGLFADYVYINETLLSQRTGMTSHEVYEGLKSLSAQNIIHYVPAQKVPTIYYVQNREELKYLEIPRSVYEERKDRLKERVENVIYYGTSSEICRSRILLKYFGEKDTANCKHCDVCLSKKSNAPGSSQMHSVRNEILTRVSAEELKVDELVQSMNYPDEQILQAVRHLSDNQQIHITNETVRK
jgi:ATP-dependent DNA helicase RecQ